MEVDSLFENKTVAKAILKEIFSLSEKLREPIKIMEVCGTHTQVIAKFGIRKILPKNIKLISGPGCPVCVTPSYYIEQAITLAKMGYFIATFGDLLKVPSNKKSLEKEISNGAKVNVVYSPSDALKIAEQNKSETVIFLAVGFETTIPSICATILEAEKKKIGNFKILSSHKIIPPALEVLAKDPLLKIDGFICPGHVSVIIGAKSYDFLPKKFNRGAVIAGFTPIDILLSVKELVRQKVMNEPENVNNYKRVVKDEGNTFALNLINQLFETVDVEWRGFGVIPSSGLKLKKRWEEFDAEKIEVSFEKPEEPNNCRCGDVLKGIISPSECPLMGKVCSPENPVGACMVSSEGSCSAYYKYERN
jgi:hydrogenase expression/formation protein HypD